MKKYVIKKADLEEFTGLSYYGVKEGHVFEKKPKAVLSLDDINQKKSQGILTCDPNQPGDPHYGEAGFYDGQCVWYPQVK